MKRETLITVGIGALVLSYIVFYIGSRRYLVAPFQNFETVVPITKSLTPGAAGPPNPWFPSQQDMQPNVPTTVETTSVELPPVEVPYTKEPINSLDDFELNSVYQNENDKAMSKELRNKLMSQMPMDWSGYPPSSSQFQAGLRESFQNATPTVPDDAKPYDTVSGSNMEPPDMTAAQQEEKKILQTYKPKFPPTGTTYNPKDAEALIKKLYDAKGEIPTVKHKEGTNVYEIVGTRRKDEKVVYEDEEAEAEATDEANPSAGESTIAVPKAVSDKSFEPPSGGGVPVKTKKNNWDYTAWTPGLERMFAPTSPQQNWY